MSNQANQNTQRFSFSALIGVGTLIVTIIALVPAFLSLNKEMPELYYSFSVQKSETPAFIDDLKFKDFLRENNIPKNRISILFRNNGNAPAKEIKFSVKVPGVIIRYEYKPPQQDNPVWVDVPDNKDYGFESSISSISQTVKKLATNKVLSFSAGYEGETKEAPEVEVYCNGKQATFISDLSKAPIWSPYRVFYLPVSILGIGLLCTILWVIGTILLRNPKIREELLDVLKLIGRSFVEAVTGFKIRI